MFNTISWSGCWQACLSGIHSVDGESNNTSEDYTPTPFTPAQCAHFLRREKLKRRKTRYDLEGGECIGVLISWTGALQSVC